MEPAPTPRFDLWIPAADAGLLPLPRLVAWADSHILRLPEPPRWLIELSLATDVNGLARAREFAPEGGGAHGFDSGRVYWGSLYLAFERGLIRMDKLLREAGQFADGYDIVPGCEGFYLLLNEIDSGGPTMSSDQPLAERVRELFAPMAEEARAALVESEPIEDVLRGTSMGLKGFSS